MSARDVTFSQTSNAKHGMNKIDWSPLWKTEDWWVVWLGFALIILSALGLLTRPILALRWGQSGSTIVSAFPGHLMPGVITAGVISFVAFSVAVLVTSKEKWPSFAIGFPLVFLLTVVASVLGNYGPWRHYGFNDVVWSLALGLLISNTGKVPTFLKGAILTELYIKTGLILLGASILFDRILVLGVRGLGVAWLVTPIVLIAMYWFSQRVLKMNDNREMAITIAAATSVCGVSAAIATGAAARAKKEDISIAISITLLFTMLMMVAMPALIRNMGLNPMVGGAWIGGTIDATGAVVAAGSMLGQEAMEVAAVIKMIQNLLIGLIAFGVAFFWVTYYEKSSGVRHRVSGKEIWVRLPKFILGFIMASLAFSFFVHPETVNSALPAINGYRGVFFALAFVSIGLDSNFVQMAKIIKQGKPVQLYLAGQVFNIVLTLLAAKIFFGIV